jgi:phosphoglycolate phosphatase-like HAD superfamily hydrolase
MFEGTLLIGVPQSLHSLPLDCARIQRSMRPNISMKAFAGVREVFEALTARGGRIALATECKGPELKRYFSLLDIDEFIAATVCGDDVEHGMPDPRVVGMALRKLDLSGFHIN